MGQSSSSRENDLGWLMLASSKLLHLDTRTQKCKKPPTTKTKKNPVLNPNPKALNWGQDLAPTISRSRQIYPFMQLPFFVLKFSTWVEGISPVQSRLTGSLQYIFIAVYCSCQPESNHFGHPGRSYSECLSRWLPCRRGPGRWEVM